MKKSSVDKKTLQARDQLVREAHVDVTRDGVALRLVSDGDARVSRWAEGREVELFERAFGRPLQVASS